MSRKIKCLITLFIISIMCITTAYATTFTDMEGHWAKDVVENMAEKGILNGFDDGSFRPNESVTREQFAKILVETLNLKEKDFNVKFEDIEEGRWSKEYIEIASKYLTGYMINGKYYFRPTEASVREDIAVAVVKASGLDNQTPNYALLDQFSDKDKISENLRKYIAIAVENEIMRGKGGYFDPQGALTRGEVCQLLFNVSEKVVIDDLEEEILYGDADGDGEITVGDATEILRFIAYSEKPVNEKAADVNLDGKITAMDAEILLNYVVENIDKLPHPCKTYTETYKESKFEGNHVKMKNCACGLRLRTDEEEHVFKNGKCVCGLKGLADTIGTHYNDAVNKLIDLGIMDTFADGTFKPDKKVTEAEFAKLLVVFLGLEPAAEVSKGETQFVDVPKDHWATGYINVAAQYGFMKGYAGSKFKPDNEINYASAITFALRSLEYELPIDQNVWPNNYISKAKELGLLENIEYKKYTDKATRGEIAILLYNMIDVPKFKHEIPGPTVTYKCVHVKNGICAECLEKINEKNFLLGDITKDGYVNVGDAMAALQYVEGTSNIVTEENKYILDVNQDGKITKMDAQLILAYSAGSIKDLPHTCKNYKEEFKIYSDYHRIKITCECGANLGSIGEDHIFKNGKCVCGEVDFIYGDIDGDGQVTARDALATLQYIVGSKSAVTKETEYIVDVNNDGKVNRFDAGLMLSYSVGNIDKLPHLCKTYREVYEEIDNETHGIEIICECGLKVPGFDEEHTFENGKCVCGVQKQHVCTPLREEIQNINDEQHSITTFCECGKEVGTNIEKHKFEGGKCECGIPCNHKQGLVKRTIRYQKIDAETHRKTRICECGYTIDTVIDKHKFNSKGSCACGEKYKEPEKNYGIVEKYIFNIGNEYLTIDGTKYLINEIRDVAYTGTVENGATKKYVGKIVEFINNEKGIIITASYGVDEALSAMIVEKVNLDNRREFCFYGDSKVIDLDRLEEMKNVKIIMVLASETDGSYEFEEVELLELSDVKIKKEDRIDTIPAGLTAAKFETAEIILIIRGIEFY